MDSAESSCQEGGGNGDSAADTPDKRGTQSESSGQEKDPVSVIDDHSLRMESPSALEVLTICAPNDGYGSTPLRSDGNEFSATDGVTTETGSAAQENVDGNMTHNPKPSGASSSPTVGDDHGGDGGTLEASREKKPLLVIAGSATEDLTTTPNISSLQVEAPTALESTDPEQVPSPKDAADSVKPERGYDSPPIPRIPDVDTASPFESVKEAVSRFGGIVDWKAHKVHSAERRKLLRQEIEKALEEIPVARKLFEASQSEKVRALAAVAEMEEAAGELELEIHRAERDEEQAKQESHFLKLRAEELRHGVPDSASLALNPLLELLTTRCAATASEQRSVKAELGSTAEKWVSGSVEREAAVSAAQGTAEMVEQLSTELTGQYSRIEQLESALESEKAAGSAVQRREGMASVAVVALEAELARVRSEKSRVQAEQKTCAEETAELPKKLQAAAVDAEAAKSLLDRAQADLHCVGVEAGRVRADLEVTSGKVRAATKAAEASKAAERLAKESVDAFRETLSAEPAAAVTVSAEEYAGLKAAVVRAEAEADRRVAAALAGVEVARESELRALKKLEEAKMELTAAKSALDGALGRADRAHEGKLGVEQELRKWRAEHVQRRREGAPIPGPDGSPGHKAVVNPPGFEVRVGVGVGVGSAVVSEMVKTKKPVAFFPRVLMFFARRKARASAKSG